MTKKLIWLEDHPELNVDFHKKLNDSGFDVVICENVGDFGKEVKLNLDNPDQVAGFILDILIRTNNLEELDMPQVTPQRGAETGYAVLRHYIRNVRDRSPIGDTFKEHPVLMLSTMSEASMRISFNTEGDKLTNWLSKADQKGHTDAALKSMQRWLQTLKG
ncbi:MAG: hypothetical protein KDF59_10270 [Nitrosomonas sp.]|nr:hypothetical protein [Nitrosomonas sp.]